MVGALLVIRARLRHRRAADQLKRLGQDVDRMLVVSSWDVHRTRLGGFDNAKIYKSSEFRTKCCESGLSWRRLLGCVREVAKRRANQSFQRTAFGAR